MLEEPETRAEVRETAGQPGMLGERERVALAGYEQRTGARSSSGEMSEMSSHQHVRRGGAAVGARCVSKGGSRPSALKLPSLDP